jgi:multidrug efflux pump subunit AcrB
MNLSRFGIEQSRVTFLLTLVIGVAGIGLYLDYPKKEDPSVRVREAVVAAHFPGMPPRRMEDLITRKLEERIREIEEVKDIISESKFGESILHVVLRDEVTDLDPVWQRLRNKMQDAAPELPDGTLGPFVNDEFGLTAVATIALWADGFSLAEMRETAREIRDTLYALPGVKRIELFGIQEERIYLEISNTKVAEFGIDPAMVGETLRNQNVILPGGTIELSGREFVIEPSGSFRDVSQIESVLLRVPNTEQSVPLRDLVTITRSYADPPEKPAYFNGHPAIMISVSLMDGVDAVAFGNTLKGMVRGVERELPLGYVLEFATFQPELIDRAVSGAVSNLSQTVIIVLIVVMLFLGVRSGLIVGSFVPLVMLFGMLGMWVFDIELQRISIASMIIALGMLVDNGIVVAEDIRTRMQQGASAQDAGVEAGRSLAVPLLTSSTTTILAFMPLMLMAGPAGEYTGSLSYVIGILMVGSWLLAMMVVPMVSARFMKVQGQGEDEARRFDTKGYHAYHVLLLWMLRHRAVVLVSVVVAMGISAWAFGNFVVKEFFPKGDRNQYLIYIDMPAGTRSSEVVERVGAINEWLLDEDENPEVRNTVAYVGQGGPRFFASLAPFDPEANKGFMLVNLQESDQVREMVSRTHNYILGRFPEVRGRVKAMWMGPSEEGLYEVRLSGPSAELLRENAERLMSALRDIPGSIDVLQDWQNPVVVFEVIVDQTRARRAGVTSRDVAMGLNAFMEGEYVTDYREGDTVIPVIARGRMDERALVTNLSDLTIHSRQTGRNVSLAQIAEFDGVGGYSRIRRRNQVRTIGVQAKHPVLKAAQIQERMEPMLEEIRAALPAGYFLELGGELEGSAEAQGNLATWMPAAFALIAMLLVWQFNSFRRALVILLTIPLVFIGATIGLLAMNAVFGFMTILGLLALAGIIINNGIVLIDRIEEEREAGTDPFDAVVRAALSRLRPIVLSAGTTVLGLLPLIIYRDVMFYGMASMMAFALTIGTILTLGVVPVLYTLFLRVEVPRAQ